MQTLTLVKFPLESGSLHLFIAFKASMMNGTLKLEIRKMFFYAFGELNYKSFTLSKSLQCLTPPTPRRPYDSEVIRQLSR